MSCCLHAQFRWDSWEASARGVSGTSSILSWRLESWKGKSEKRHLQRGSIVIIVGSHDIVDCLYFWRSPGNNNSRGGPFNHLAFSPDSIITTEPLLSASFVSSHFGKPPLPCLYSPYRQHSILQKSIQWLLHVARVTTHQQQKHPIRRIFDCFGISRSNWESFAWAQRSPSGIAIAGAARAPFLTLP